MAKLFAGIHIADKPNEYLPLDNVDFEKTVLHLKAEIGEKIDFPPETIELVYQGLTLNDDAALSTIDPNSTVHVFRKTKKYEPYVPNLQKDCERDVQILFNVISNIQINVNSRVNILQKILAEYPEFRRNLGAQALIRDSVLFNTLHQPEVVEKIAQKYPIICEAAPYIVETVKKELARNSTYSEYKAKFPCESENSSNPTVAENVSDTATSSEEENTGTSANQTEQARIRRISRHQLAAALQQAGSTSMNTLSDIAQRNSVSNDSGSGTNPQTPQASAGRILPSTFSNALARALGALGANNPTGSIADTVESNNDALQWMDTSDLSDINSPSDNVNDLPARYRDHQYAEQLRLMSQMGFTNYAENISFLTITNGNVENAVNLVMGSHDR